MTIINIWGRYRGRTEQLDSASSWKEANYLVAEYRLAFGSGWSIWAGNKTQATNNLQAL